MSTLASMDDKELVQRWIVNNVFFSHDCSFNDRQYGLEVETHRPEVWVCTPRTKMIYRYPDSTAKRLRSGLLCALQLPNRHRVADLL